jgi:hypothetical protein
LSLLPDKEIPMRALQLLLAASLSLASAMAQAQATVEVVFTPKVRFFDAGDTRRDVERTEATLGSHLQALGQRWLAPGAKLRVEVTEIDLAGRIPAGRPDAPRVLTGGADWPRITLSYELTGADGKVERGDASVSDMNYMNHIPKNSAAETLAHEKRMLDEWFRQRFAQAPG